MALLALEQKAPSLFGITWNSSRTSSAIQESPHGLAMV
jgi:hypothetical protein